MAAPPSPVCCLSNEVVPSLPQIARIFSAPPGCLLIHLVKSKTFPYTILQQLALESRLLTSSRVSLVRLLLALGVADFDGEGLWVALLDGDGVELADGLADELTDALGVFLMTVPLFQTS